MKNTSQVIQKKLSFSFDKIERFKQESAYKVQSSSTPINKCISTIKYIESQGFLCKYFIDKSSQTGRRDNDLLRAYGINENISFEKSGEKYSIMPNSIVKASFNLGSPQIITVTYSQFQSKQPLDFSKKFIRVIIPVKKEPNLEMFDLGKLQVDKIIYWGIIQISIKNRKYEIYRYTHKNKKKHLVIDSLEETEITQFKKDIRAISLSLGFLGGSLLQGECFYLASLISDFSQQMEIEYNLGKENLISPIKLFDPINFIHLLKENNQEKILNQISPFVKTEVLTNLCEKLLKNETFSRSLNLILAGHQAKTVMLAAGIYSIALETITNIVYEENKDKINPIPDKNLAKEICKELNEVLNQKKYTESLDDYGKAILKAKIDNLNSPTNSKKLSMPFKILNLKLSEEDLIILRHRNKFLHGTAPFNESQLKEKEEEIICISKKLLLLVSSLVLKFVGYEGHILNLETKYKIIKNQEIKEHLFKII